MTRPWLLFIAPLPLLAACAWDTFDPRIDATGGAGGGAGEGGEAVGGGGEGGGEGGRGGGGAGGGSPADCGHADLLQDDFEDADLDAQLWSTTANSSSVTQANGSLALSLGTSSSYGNAYITTRHFHDMRGSSAAVEVSSVDLVAPAWAFFNIHTSDGNEVRFFFRNASLRAEYLLNGSTAVLATLPYSPTEHRWWRIREDAGVVYWEVSPDGTAFTAVAERNVAGLFGMDQVRMRARAYADGTVPLVAPTFAIDNLVIEGPGSGKWCPVSSLRDDFADGYRSHDWLLAGGTTGADMLEIDGQVFVNLIPGVADPVYRYISSRNYDLTANQVTVELAEHGTGGVTSLFELSRQGQSISLLVTDVDDGMGNVTTEIQAMTDVDGDVQARGAKPYNPAVHRFLRIRHDGVGLLWDTSADGTSWPTESSDERAIAGASPTPTGLVIDDLDVRFGGMVIGTAENPGQSRFDNLNVLPTE